ncbi:MAG: pirin family protein [Planctomycetales bacterium]|nr:pirin family protein [Planctomycetales bacterium]
MLRIRRSSERGHVDHGWLNARHTFSFASYQDPEYACFRSLRVMNEDVVAPSGGFGTHPHNDMEIVTYVLEGAIEHRDSMGNREVLKAGEFQRMTAGTGITHSEFNPSNKEPTHLYQIWIYPERKGIAPSYEQKRFPDAERRNRLRLVASRDAGEESLLIHQDARIYLATLDRGRSVSHDLSPQRHAWLQVLRGNILFNGVALGAGDGAAASEENRLRMETQDGAEIMLFDLT